MRQSKDISSGAASEGLRARLAALLGPDGTSAEEAVRLAYATDNSRRVHVPDLVAWPQDEAQVAATVRLANETATPLYVRGRGTATTGASLAERGGVVLSTERLDRILAIDPAARTATVEPGVLNGALAAALAAQGMFWPPDPSSANYCSVGGNLATAAAGPRGLKYGGVRENVLALRAIAGSGELLAAGAPVPKAVAGYDLARLLLGSEGSLAVITAATLRLAPLPGAARRAVASYASEAEAAAAVAAVQRSPLTLAALEFLDAGCIDLVRAAAPELPAAARALLLLECDGLDEDAAAAGLRRLEEVLAPTAGLLELDAGAGGAGLWRLRKVLSQKLREVASVKINEDVVVPASRLAELLAFIAARAAEARLRCLSFGHAGAGNLHVNVLFDDEGDRRARAGRLVAAIMEQAVALDGCVSGEHGIGIAKRGFLPLQLDAGARAISRRVKDAFDPNGVLHGRLTPA